MYYIRLSVLLAGMSFVGWIPSSVRALTVIVDFNDVAQANTSLSFSFGGTAPSVGTFDVTDYGFLEGQRQSVYDSIMLELERDFFGIPTTDVDALSPIPAGMELDIDFEIGDVGTGPSNGDTEFYYVQVGDHVAGDFGGSLGVAATSTMRSSTGGNAGSFIGLVVGSIHTDQINGIGLPAPGNQLTSGNLSATTHAVNGTLAHEIAHALSLLHLDKAGSDTFSNLPPIMGTGAVDLPNVDRISDRDFSYSGFNDQQGGAAQSHVLQLVNAIGLRNMMAVPEPSTAIPMLALMLVIAVRRNRKG